MQVMMKKHIGITLFTILGIGSFSVRAQDTIPAPPCQQVDLITNKAKRSLISSFLDSALSQSANSSREFVNDKGIIHLYRYQNAEGDSVWRLIPVIDDRYKDNPPQAFADVQGDIALIWDADEQGRPLKNPNPPEPYVQCLEQVIGDRVYLRPTIKTRWTSHVLPWGRKRKHGNHRVSTGGGGAIEYVFKSDSTYQANPMF